MFINNKGQQFTQHYKNYLEQQSCIQNLVPNQMRKKIQNYSFLLKDKIGRGYSSIVYKGINDLTNQQVAIKVIELKSLRDHTCKIMLQNQIECMKEMKHKHILRYQNSFFTINNCYIVTELCEKGDLSKDIKEKKKFSEEEAGKMFYQIYQAYLHFHNAGYVHRDIKPANIFINSQNQLKIADFGFSKKRTIIEREAYNVGTPIYMSPQSLTANIYNEKTDVWALGVTLYELVSGEVPFKGKTQKELKVEIDKCCLDFPSIGLSQQLIDFIKRCLKKDSFSRMSIKDMHKHQWLSKIIGENNPSKVRQYIDQTIFTQPFRAYEQLRTQQDCQQNKSKKNDNFNEINLRISLPNHGLHENKSNRYFKVQDLGQKENRRSTNGKIQNIVSMQRLKIQKKKSINNFEIDRPALHERTNSITNIEHLEDLKIRRNPYSLVEITQKPKQKDLPPKLNKPVTSSPNSNNIENLKQKAGNGLKQSKEQSKNMQKVVVLINYFRLIYQIDEKIKNYFNQIYHKQVLTVLKELNSIFSNELVSNFTMHIQMSKTKDNIFGLKESLWAEFTNSNRWDVYKYVIQRYEVKYKQLLQVDQREYSSSNHNLDILIKPQVTLLIAKEDELSIRQKYILNQILYFIFHFLNYYQLIKDQGWDEFTQKRNSSQKMVINDLVLNINNYIEISAINKDNYKKICLCST